MIRRKGTTRLSTSVLGEILPEKDKDKSTFIRPSKTTDIDPALCVLCDLTAAYRLRTTKSVCCHTTKGVSMDGIYPLGMPHHRPTIEQRSH
jgi:hypothetical protein